MVSNMLPPLNQREIAIMSYLYQFRILTVEQIHQKWWSKSGIDGESSQLRSCKDKLRKFMTRTGYISMSYSSDKTQCYVQLTAQGILALRSLPVLFIGTRQRPFQKGDILSPSRLFLHPRLFTHQTALNQFVLNFERQELPVSWTYYDEKLASKILPGIRPDGILHIEDTYYFLEMDMDTERDRALKTKWEHYREFLNSPTFHNLVGKIRVLFIANCYSPHCRASRVRTLTFDSLFDKFSGKFDAYFGSPDEMLDIISRYTYEEELMDRSMIPYMQTLERLGYDVKMSTELKHDFSDMAFTMFIKTKKEDTGSNEFFVCDFRYVSSSVLHDIYDWHGTLLRMKEKTGRVIPYLVICESFEKCVSALMTADVDLDNTDVFYTTIDRLRTMLFCKALVRLDRHGNVYNFNDNTLTSVSFEYTLSF